MVIRGIIKLFSFGKLERNAEIFGTTFAYVNYIINAAVLVVFVVFIVLFINKKKNTWRYFIYFIGFLILGVILSIILSVLYIDKVIEILPGYIPPNFLLALTFIALILLLAFYSLVIYFVYKNRRYFGR